MKKLQSMGIFLVFIALSISASMITSATETNEVYFDPSTVTVPSMGTVDVELRVNAEGFQGGQVELTYDPSCCNVINFNLNNADFTYGGWNSDIDGREFITFVSNVLLSGDYLIGTLTIQCVGEEGCSTSLVIDNDESNLYDDRGTSVPANWIAGTFNCEAGEVPPENVVYFDPSTVTVPSMGTVDVELRVNAEGFQGGQVELTYDPSCCNVINFNLNNADFTYGGWNSDIDGREFITFVSNVLLSGDYLIGTLTIQCVGEEGCSTSLVIDNDESNLYDDRGTSVPANWINGDFSCAVSMCDFSLELDAGWNLVSIPKMLDVPTTASILFDLQPGDDSVPPEVCIYYDASSGSWVDASDTNVIPCRGYWVFKSSSYEVCMNFSEPEPQSLPPQLQLYEGWNLIGSIDTTPMPIEDGSYSDFSSIAGLDTSSGGHKFAQILGWTGSGWVSYPMGSLSELLPGHGYWIAMNEDAVMFGTV